MLPRYRIVQFLRNLWDAPTQVDLQLVRDYLPASLHSLFFCMTSADQAHSIRVCRALIEQGYRDPDLLSAALLHDVGKTVISPHILERVLYVLANQIAPERVLRWSEAEPRGWRRAFVIALNHADWGADLVAEHGGSSTTVLLIRRHQSGPEPGQPESDLRLLSLLQAADGGN